MKALKTAAGVAVGLMVLLTAVFFCTPAGHGVWNTYAHQVQKVDDATSYRTRKVVEDTCRATIVSYEADRLTWLQYKDSPDADQRSWADAAKLRANKAALTYNEYFLKNSYVFSGNIPQDIREKLPLILEEGTDDAVP